MTRNNNEQIPKVCYGVKCMQQGCQKMAAHKIGEYNIWDVTDSEEAIKHYDFNRSHERTTYLCETHFSSIMNREEEYHENDERFPNKPD